jgi:hypothetical protein
MDPYINIRMDTDQFHIFKVFDNAIDFYPFSNNVIRTPTTSPLTPEGFTYGMDLTLETNINNNIFNYIYIS